MSGAAKLGWLLLVFPFCSAMAATPPALAARPAAGHGADKLGVAFYPTLPSDTEVEDVFVLPKFEVRDSRIELDERDVLSSKELLAQAKARYLHPVYQKTLGQLSAAAGILANLLSILNGWHPNDAEATVLFQEDERLRHIKESKEWIDVFKKTDPAAFKELKNSLNDTFERQPIISTRRGE
jgi:hypothetical protein